MNPLTDSIQLRITRSIEHALYTKLLENGLIPNRTTFAGNPTGYAAKQAEIKDRKGFCVEVFGHGSAADRDMKFIPRMVITGQGFLPGSLGNGGTTYFERNANNTYDQKQAATQSSNFRFELEIVSNKASQDNVLESIKAECIPNLNYLEVYDAPGESFLVQYGGIRNIPDFSNGLIRKVYTYVVVDVFERMSRTISQVSPIKEITVTDAKDNSEIVKVP